MVDVGAYPRDASSTTARKTVPDELITTRSWYKPSPLPDPVPSVHVYHCRQTMHPPTPIVLVLCVQANMPEDGRLDS